MNTDSVNQIIGYFQAVVRMASPILIASLGGMFTARAGIINFALEGMMLAGAFFSVYGSFLTGSPWIGLLMGVAGAVGVSMILGFISITAKVNQVVAGEGINILCFGLTSYLLNVLFGIGAKPSAVVSFTRVRIPLLADIPFIGPILFNQILPIYGTLLIVPVIWYVIYKTPFGLHLRSVGENPAAADSVGISVVRTRYTAVLLSGVFAGIGGAMLAIGNLSVFMEGMVAGRGYVAWAAVTVGKWNPVGILGVSFLFGGVDAIQLRFQSLGINVPYQLLLMLPYLLTMLVLAGVVGKTMSPAAMGKPYSKE
jgi:simple sugar transport system permease protein